VGYSRHIALPNDMFPASGLKYKSNQHNAKVTNVSIPTEGTSLRLCLPIECQVADSSSPSA
jgi:hypothetical protein